MTRPVRSAVVAGRSICLLAALPLAACGVTFQFGAPPVLVPQSDPPAQCLQAARISVRPASGSWESTTLTGYKSEIQGNYRVSTTTYRIDKHGVRGATFFKGDRRLTMMDLLEELKAPYFTRAYMAKVDQYTSRRRSRQAAVGALWGIGFSLVAGGLTVGSLGLTNKDGRGEQTKTGKIMLYSGMGAALLGLIFIPPGGFLIGGLADAKHREEVHKTIFVSRELAGPLAVAIDAYNRKMEARCAGKAR